MAVLYNFISRRLLMPLTVRKEDRTPKEAITLHLHPNIIQRLKEHAKTCLATDGKPSDLNYVAGDLLDQALPALKKPKKTDSTERKVA